MAVILILILGLAFIVKSLEQEPEDDTLDHDTIRQSMVSDVLNYQHYPRQKLFNQILLL
jgi:hypothetical protein